MDSERYIKRGVWVRMKGGFCIARLIIIGISSRYIACTTT